MRSSVKQVFNTVELLEMILLQVILPSVSPHFISLLKHIHPFQQGCIGGAKTVIAAQRVSKALYTTIRGSSKLQDALGFTPNALPTAAACFACSCRKPMRCWATAQIIGSILTRSGVLEWRFVDKESLKMSFKGTGDLLVYLHGSWQGTYISDPGTIVRRLVVQWQHEGGPLTAEKDCYILDPTLGALAARAVEIAKDSMEQGTCFSIGTCACRCSCWCPEVRFMYHGLKDWNAEVAAIEKWMT